MQPFEPVIFNFKGKEYRVAPENVWGLIGTIENVISRVKLAMRVAAQDVPETKIAEAYAAALQFAGAKISHPREVLQGLTFQEILALANVLFSILNLANPPAETESEIEPPTGAGDPAGK